MGRAVAIQNEYGVVVQWIGTATDIHRLKEAERELRRYNEQLEQFAYAAAHDLQEPLRNAAISSELLGRHLADKLDGPGQEMLSDIRGNAKRMARLVSDLLSYTQAVQNEHRATVVDANEVVQEVLETFAVPLKTARAQVSVEGLGEIFIFRAHLLQVIQNLVGNAVKYRDPNRELAIRISAERRSFDWLFTVEDNGIGIRPVYHERIFGVFKRLHNSKVEGTGVGLAIVKRIVEYYGGRVWVESDEGRGAAFRFTLPFEERATVSSKDAGGTPRGPET